MKNKICNFFIKLSLLIIAVFLGIVFYKFIVRECIGTFIKIDLTGKKGFIIYNFLKLTTVMMIYSGLLVVFRRKTSKVFKVFITGLYIGTMIILLFARPKISRGFNFNLLSVFHDLHRKIPLMYFIGNIIFFMPIGYLLRNDGFIRSLILAVSLELNIELLQYAFKRGYFDISDIFVNLIGIYIAYFLCKTICYLFKNYC